MQCGEVISRAIMVNVVVLLATINVPAQTKYTLKDIGGSADASSQANGINKSGEVVGSSGNLPILYDGTIHKLGSADGMAWGINSAGQVVGRSGLDAFLYDGTMHDLGTLPGDRGSLANAINDTGLVVGASGNTILGVSHAFLYDGTMHDLGTLAGLNSSVATAINNTGQIAGYSLLNPQTTSPAPYRAWVYDGTLHDLGIPGPQSLALAINDSGVVVGAFYSSSLHAFVYTSGQVYDLNNYLDAGGEGWTLIEATGINASGQITGWGSHNSQIRGFLLTPIDTIPPVISGMSPAGCSLWPPNGRMVQVAHVTATDAQSGVGSFHVTGTSNEPPNDSQILITPDGSGGYIIQLQADRLGDGNGRVYLLTAIATDRAGNSSTVTATCTVPHDKR